MALGDIDLHFAWQAWHLATSISTLRGMRGADGSGLALVARLGGRIFFMTLCPKKIIRLGILFSPNFGSFKVGGVVPWKNIQRRWGCNQRKAWSFSEPSLLETCKGINRNLATGTLSRDVCPHGPKIDSRYFLCTMYAWGLCPFLGMEIYSKKSLAPRNFSGINLGTTPRRHHTRG